MVSEALSAAEVQRFPREFTRWQQAQRQLVGGHHGLALGAYQALVKRFPGVPQLWFELGIAAAGDLEFSLAEQAFQRTEKLAALDGSLLVLVGQQYCRIQRFDQARDCFQRAVAADRTSIHAGLSLAAWWEREGRLEEALTCVEDCLRQDPRHPQARCVKGLVLHRLGRNSEAETLLRDLVRSGVGDVNVKQSSRHLLGVVLDTLGQYAEAVRWPAESKALLRTSTNVARMERDYDAADSRRREVLAGLTADDLARWRQEPLSEAGQPPLALLAGHPRSGTTLLEQILAAHPQILAFDEPEAFAAEVWNQLAPIKPDQPLSANGLSALPLAVRGDYARRYFRSLLHLPPPQPSPRVVLDKNPSLTGALHLWLRLFPHSRIIIALRDPRDVILSAFFQNLALTPTNANFLSLDRAAKHYRDLMDTWRRLRDLGGFDWMETHYEDMVTDVETHGRQVTTFLGLEWHPSQAVHAQNPRRNFVFSPTYSDAAKPIHRRAVGRWHNYAEVLAPVQAGLAPYCRAFGYPLDGVS